MIKINRNIKVALTYIGAVIGAGFASGQELVKFFGVFQEKGLWGTLLAGISFALLGSLIIVIVNKTKVTNYGQLVKVLFPEKLEKIFEILIALFLWVGLGVMFVGSIELLKSQFNLALVGGFLFTAGAIYLSLVFGSEGLMNVNTLLVPFLLIIAVVSSLMYINSRLECFSLDTVLGTLIPNWWVGSLNYVAYNIILAIVVLASIGEENKRISPISGLLGGLTLGTMAFVMVKGMLHLPQTLLITEMPMLHLTKAVNQVMGLLYSLALWIALFTTALANAHSLTKRMAAKTYLSYKKVLFLVIVSTVIFIPWNFSTLVGVVYPLLGYLGIPLIIAIFIELPGLLFKK
jgi:uncharacterized membrane protein YkvI